MHEVEHVLSGRGDCVAHGRRVHARVFNRRRVTKFGGRVGGVRVAECLPPRRVVGLFCHWIADRFFIAAFHRRINFVFARTQHVGIRARIRGRDRSAGSASAPKHAHRIGNDICVVAGREFGVGIYLERARPVA